MNSNITLNKRKTLLATFVAMFAAGATTQGAMAQTESATAQSRIDEIVVTASKRATSLQDTALSVSAISGADLSKLGVTGFDQVLATIPGVTVLETGPGNSRVVYRGISTDSSGFNGNAITATYLDEFPLGQKDVDIKLVDMARIESLKGPQGTLYGQSALGGVLRFITNKPSFEAIEGGMELTGERVADGGDGYQTQGYINIPLSDNLAVRAVFYDHDRPGFIDNLGTGTKDINTEEVTGGRLALRWNMSDQAEFDLLYLNQSQSVGGGQAVGVQMPTSLYTPVLNGVPTDITSPDLENPSFRSTFDPSDTLDFEALNLKLNVNFEQFDLSLMATTREREKFREVDFSIFRGIYDDVTAVFLSEESVTEAKTFEGRLVSTGDGPLEWIAGVWYEKWERNFNFSQEVQTPRTDLVLFGAPFADGDFILNRDTFKDAEELAVYGEVGYRFTDQAKLTLGYRRADLKRDSAILSATGFFQAGAIATMAVDESHEEDVNTYKIHFEYQFNDDVLAYALATSGYRAGGWNRSGVAQVSAGSQFDTDTLWNYEVGVRSSWLDNRLVANAVAYYIDWSDMQLRAWDSVAQVQRIQNVGKAEIFGLETEINFQATNNLSLSVNYAYTDASTVEDFLDESTTPVTVLAADGTGLPGSSKHAVSLFADWQSPLTSSLDLLVNANYRYVSSRPNVLGSFPGLFVAFPEDIPSADIFNLSASVRHDNGVSVSLFANNLFDKRNAQFRARMGTALEGVSVNRPRTIGLRVGYQF